METLLATRCAQQVEPDLWRVARGDLAHQAGEEPSEVLARRTARQGNDQTSYRDLRGPWDHGSTRETRRRRRPTVRRLRLLVRSSPPTRPCRPRTAPPGAIGRPEVQVDADPSNIAAASETEPAHSSHAAPITRRSRRTPTRSTAPNRRSRTWRAATQAAPTCRSVVVGPVTSSWSRRERRTFLRARLAGARAGSRCAASPLMGRAFCCRGRKPGGRPDRRLCSGIGPIGRGGMHSGYVPGWDAERHSASSASLMGSPVNWISWPAPSTTARPAPMRSATESHISSNALLCPPETTSFGKVADANGPNGRSASHGVRPLRRSGTSGRAPCTISTAACPGPRPGS